MGRDKDFDGKVIALTGGASGIGLATSKILHARGASISIGDIDQAALDNAASLLKDEGSGRVMLTRLDVTNRNAVDTWIGSTVERFGKLDGAANCAGVIGKHHGTRKVEELEDDQWDLIVSCGETGSRACSGSNPLTSILQIGVNLTGMMYSLRAELQAIKGPGSVVCVGSVQGTMGFAKHAAYVASKHGVHGLVRSAAKEVGERKIRVNIVAP